MRAIVREDGEALPMAKEACEGIAIERIEL